MKAKGIAAIVASALGFALMAALVRLADGIRRDQKGQSILIQHC